MAGGDAHLRASLVLDANLEDAVRKATEGLTNIEGQVAKSQDKLKKIIEKGDPLYALKKQQEREIAEVEKHVAKDARLRELAELSKAQIVEKYAKKRQQVEENVSRAIERAQMATRDNIGKFEQKFNAARGVMDAFGASSSTAIGQVTSGLADLAQGFAVGGAAGLAVTGLTTLVFKLGTAWSDAASSAMKAKIAITTEWEDADAAIKAMIDSAKDDVLRRRDRLAGVSEDALRGQAIFGAASEQQAARASNVNSIQGRINQNNAAMAPLLAQIKAIREGNPHASDATKIADLQTQIDPLAQAVAADTAMLRDANRFLAEARKNLGEAELLKQQLTDTGAAEKLAAAAKKAAGKSPKAFGDLNDLPNAVDLLNAATPGGNLPDAVDLMGIGLTAQDKQSEADRNAAMQGAIKDAAAFQKSQAAAAAQTLKANTDAAQRAEEQWASAGISAAGQFAGAFKSFLDSKDPADLFGGLLRAAGGIIASISTLGVGGIAGGGALSILGGFFEQGGVPYAHHIPQGRNGLATLPGLNFDAKPAWLHPEEVVMPRDVVNDDFGGLPNAMRVAAGHGLPGGGGNVTIVQQNMAFDTPSLDRVWGRAEGVQKQRFTNRQGGAMQSALRSAVLTPRFA